MRRIFALLIVVVGLSAFICAVAGLLPHEGARLALDLSPGGWERFSRVLFGATAVLGLNEPDPAPTSHWFTAARVLAVLFTVTAASGIVLEFYQPARDGMRRLWFRVLRLLGRPPAVVIGLGWIGSHLAQELRADGRPVYGITLDRRSPGSDEASARGVLVLEGDAMDEAVRRQVGPAHATEVFIATGDDGQNIDIAGRLLENQTLEDQTESGSTLLAPGACCYVHADDPAFAATVRGQELLPLGPTGEVAGGLVFRMFCSPALTARDLFLDLFLDLGVGFQTPGRVGPRPLAGTDAARPPITCPDPGEAFHLFVLGFGRVGQAAALHTARFAHFASRLRPRLTVFPDVGTDADPWAAFLDRYPAFSPPDLDLGAATGPSRWDQFRGRPASACYRTAPMDRSPGGTVTNHVDSTPHVDSPPHLDGPPYVDGPPGTQTSVPEGEPPSADALEARRPAAVEYAVDAECIPTAMEADADHLLDDVLHRLNAAKGGVRAAIVVSFPDERRGVHAALRLQRGLRRRLLCDRTKSGGAELEVAADAEGICPLPIYVHLPTEAGLAALLRRRRARALPGSVEHYLPICSFGERGDVATHAAITQGDIREEAMGLDALHQLTAERSRSHPDFDASNIDAVVHAEVKWDALGITFHRPPLPGGAVPLLETLFTEEVREAFQDISPPDQNKDMKPVHLLPAGVAARLNDLSVEAREALQERCALELGRLLQIDDGSARLIQRNATGWDIGAFHAIIDRVIRRFTAQLDEAGVDADVAAEMEHNRWMGERLMKGWRYGAKDNGREQRPTFLPWALLTTNERRYDRQQLPRLIVARRREGLIACMEEDRQHGQARPERPEDMTEPATPRSS